MASDQTQSTGGGGQWWGSGTDWHFGNIGEHYGKEGWAFGQDGYLSYHRSLFDAEGYTLGQCISNVMGNLYDNQIWIVRDSTDDRQYACKVASLCYYERPELNPDLQLSVTALLKESETLRRLSHTNIIRHERTFGLRDEFTGFPYAFHCMIVELMTGTLRDLQVRYPNEHMSESMARQWFRQIASGVHYLHHKIPDCWVAHLAIKPLNVLYRTVDEERDRHVFKLIDFEECQLFPKRGRDSLPEREISPNDWSAPELRRSASYRGLPSRPMDVYALSRTLLSTLIGRSTRAYNRYMRHLSYRLGGTHYVPLADSQLTPVERQEFNELSEECGQLLLRTLMPDPSYRPTIKQVLTDAWLSMDPMSGESPLPSVDSDDSDVDDDAPDTSGEPTDGSAGRDESREFDEFADF